MDNRRRNGPEAGLYNLKRLRQLIAELRTPRPNPWAKRDSVTFEELFEHIKRFEQARGRWPRLVLQ